MLKFTHLVLWGVLAWMLPVTACSGIPLSPSQSAAPAEVAPVEITPAFSSPVNAPAVAATPAPGARSQADQRNAQDLGGIEAIMKRLGLMVGVVRASNDAGLALRTPNGNEKIVVSANTLIVVPGKTAAKLADIHTGDRVIVSTSAKPDLANFVLAMPAAYSANNVMLGAVTANANNTLTVRTPKETHTLKTNPTTVVVKTDQDAPALGSLADIKPGNVVLALGNSTTEASTAQTLVILKDNLRGALAPNQKTAPALPKPKPNAPVPTPKSGG